MRSVLLLCLAALGCSSREASLAPELPWAEGAARDDLVGGRLSGDRLPGDRSIVEPAAFPSEVRSVRLRRSTVVKLMADGAAKNLGAVAADTRVAVRGAALGAGCKGRWIAIAPRGWICEDFVEPSRDVPSGVELPKLGRGERVPGTYGKVIGPGARIATLVNGQLSQGRSVEGSTMVHKLAEVVLGGTSYWRIAKDEYVKTGAIRELPPPEWQGVRLGDETDRGLPLAFAVSAKHVLDRVTVWAEPGAVTKVRTLSPRALVPIQVRDPSGSVQIGDGEWLRATDIRVVELAAPPPGLTPASAGSTSISIARSWSPMTPRRRCTSRWCPRVATRPRPRPACSGSGSSSPRPT